MDFINSNLSSMNWKNNFEKKMYAGLRNENRESQCYHYTKSKKKKKLCQTYSPSNIPAQRINIPGSLIDFWSRASPSSPLTIFKKTNFPVVRGGKIAFIPWEEDGEKREKEELSRAS